MLRSTIARIVDFSTRQRWLVIATALIVAILASIYAAQHFAIDTDIDHLISTELPWRKHKQEFDRVFPQRSELILVVIEAPTPENAKQATEALAAKLSERRDVLKAVNVAGGGDFFRRNGLLHLSKEELASATTGLTSAQPLLGTLVTDPSLRGVLDALLLVTTGVQRGQVQLDDLARPLTLASDTLDRVLAGQPASFSWRVLTQPAETKELRRFIEAHPILNFSALEPGKAASDAIRQTAAELGLAQDYGARVRLTGPIPMSDEEYATLKQSAPIDILLTMIAVVIILWLALHWVRLILACFISLIVGLAATAALGLMLVGAINLISVAFAVLFIGLGVDFGIQFSVRYRTERREIDDLLPALHNAGHNVGAQLTLAAAAVAAGFFSFLPTDYRGLSELGIIAGGGMVIAFITSVTLLPALISLFNPPGEPHELGYRALAPVDRLLERHRILIVVVTLLVAVLGSPLLYFLHFDFNLVNLRSPKAESVATYLELKKDANAGVNSIHVLAPSLTEADSRAKRIAQLSEVSEAMTLSNFVPAAQEDKLALIRKTAAVLNPTINPQRSRAFMASAQPLRSPPSDAENILFLNRTINALRQLANEEKGSGAAAAQHLSDVLSRLAHADPAVRMRAEAAFIPPLKVALDDLRDALKAQRVALDSLPSDLKRNWVVDGRALIEVLPKGDPNDNEVMRKFASAVLALEPTATGFPVSLQEYGRTVVRAFIEAGIFSLLSITILLWIVLRRLTDVLLTLVPLLLAGVVTLEICVLIDLPLNFANIIALPLLLGVGVAFKIYFVMAWRAGQTQLLQSSLTRAVFFSAMTTVTAFGSLWNSHHQGMSSMGKLLVLSLLTTLAAAVLFQPALMGPPRDKQSERAPT